MTDRYDRELYRCSGFAAPEHRPGDFVPFAADRAGLQSSAYLMTDLSGDGRLWGVGIEARLARDAVIVVPSTADFSPASDAATYATGPNPRTVLAADLNGDGSRDLAVTFDGPFDRSTPGGVSVFLNNGDGTFAPALTAPLGNFAFKAAAGDWNRDGFLDLAVSQSQPQSVMLLSGNGDGTFQPPVQLSDQASPALVSGDLNGDGRLDLIAAMSNGFRYFPGAAAGGLGPAVEVDLGLAGTFSLELGDFNSDGRMDVAQGSLAGQFVSVALNEGGDRFSARRYLAGRDPIDLHAMDFDGDGVQDVVVAGGHPARLGPNSEGGQIAVLRGRGDGSFLGAQVLGGPEPAGVAAADFNGDGADDIAMTVRGGVEVWLSDGAGSFSTPVATAVTGGARLGEIAAADLNGDARQDAVVADQSGRALALIGRGDGSFDPPAAQAAPDGARFVETGDFDGDGRPDAAVGGQSAVAIFLSNADGTLQAARNAALPGPFRPSGLAAGDFNRDGSDDLAVADGGELSNRDGKVSVFLATGGGAFATPTSFAAERTPSGLLATDSDEDGALDLLVTTGGDDFRDFIATFHGDGAGGFTSAGVKPTDFGPGEMAHVDLDGDGRRDLLVMHCCGQTDPTYLRGEGAGLYQPEVAFFGGASPLGLAVGDFNRDGRPDLAIQSNSNPPSGVSVLINAAERPSGPVHVSAASFFTGPLAADMLVTAFGSGFAQGQAEATSTPLPTTLADSQIVLTDANGARRDAGLIFMSPGQANYHVPAETAQGTATVSIEPGAGPAQQATVEIDRIAPGLFFLNSQRLAAATILRVTASGERIVEQVFEVDAQGAVQPRPIDFGPESDRLFLVVFGTGFRGRASLSQVRLIVDGLEHAAAYAGEQGTFVGLDQANAELRRELAGRGNVELQLQVEDRTTNTVRLHFR